MALTLQDVEEIAHLARLELSDEQKKMYQEQLSAILEYAEMLTELDLDGVEPTTRAVPMRNIWREDGAEAALDLNAVLQNAPQQAENQFVIQAVLDE